ncbi:MAG: hypothetical protein ACK4N5_07755, partial [Myxococcales bacterium]
MRRLLALTLLATVTAAIALGACSSREDENRPPPDGDGDDTVTHVDVSGTAELHPLARAWYAAQGVTALPAVEGEKLAIDEPFLAFTRDP